MFFKRLLVGFIILGVLSFIFGDYILWYQAKILTDWQYYMQAYNSCERLLYYYPNSVFKDKTKKLIEELRRRDPFYLKGHMEKKEAELKQKQAELEEKASFR